jgi:LysR family transcriptional regulator for metE and metH
MVLEVSHLRLVDAVARAGTVTRAAQELHVTQPAVSHRLRELEERLKVRLFRRAGRRMVPTDEGARVLESARALLQELERLEDTIAAHREGRRGTLRVATECYFCYSWLPSTFKRLSAALPNVDIQIVPEATRNPMGALLDRTLDVAILFNLVDDSRIATRELFRDEIVALVPAGHPLARRAFLNARDFEGVTLLCHFASPDRQDVLDREVLVPAGVKPKNILEMQVTAAVLEMVRAGLGVGVVPLWALTDGRAPSGIRIVRITRKGLFRTWHTAVRKEEIGKPATDTFVRLLAEDVDGNQSRARRAGRRSR